MTDRRRTDGTASQPTDRAASQPTESPDTTMTTTDRPDDARTDPTTLADVSHTHPDTGRTFGGNFTFARGGAVAADGGRPDVNPEDDESETLADVDHTPPNDSEDANRVFERGEEGPDEDDDEGVPEDE
jgi:hypothetical protein